MYLCEIEHLYKSRKISKLEAIRRVREYYNASLHDAKKTVDNWDEDIPRLKQAICVMVNNAMTTDAIRQLARHLNLIV